MSTVQVEVQGEVTVVTINRPEVRNAVDHPTALLLASAFRAFDEDDTQKVAVLTERQARFARERISRRCPLVAVTRSALVATVQWGQRGCCSTSQ